MGKILIVLLAIVLGVVVAELTAVGAGYLIEHPRVLRCTSAGRIGNEPMPAGLEKIIGQQCRAQMEREGDRRRFEVAHNMVTIWAVTIFARLLDPITLLLAGVLSALFAWILLRMARH